MVVIIPMAGQGSRFSKEGIVEPKPLIKVNNMTLIEHSVKTLDIDAKYIFITRRYEKDSYNNELIKILDRIAPDNVNIQVNYLTKGSVDSALKAVPFLRGDDQIIETNCDQHLNWYSNKFINFVNETECDGAVVTYESLNNKNSFALIEDNKISKIVEKEVISEDALIGLHYWKVANDFIRSCTSLIKDKLNEEVYISETYNYLIKEGKIILPFKLEDNQYKGLGTPEDVNKFLSETI